MTRKRINELYRDWRKENGNQKPNRVIVRMHWEDDENTDKGYQVDTIAMIPMRKIESTEDIPGDALILFYISTLKGLWALTKPNNGSDFVIDEVLEFYKM